MPKKTLMKQLSSIRKLIESKLWFCFLQAWECLLWSKKVDKAIDSYNNAIVFWIRKYIYVYLNLGNAHSVQKKFNKAIKYYNKAIELDPNYAPTFYKLGNAYYDQNKLDEAI